MRIASALCGQEKSPLRACALSPRLLAQHRVGPSSSSSRSDQSPRGRRRDSPVTPSTIESVSPPEDSVADGRHAVLRGLRSPPGPSPLCATAADAPNTVYDFVFGHVVDVTVEGHRIGDAKQRGVIDQALMPPSAADDVQVQVRHPRPQRRRPRRGRPRSVCAAPAATAPRPAASLSAAPAMSPRGRRRGRCGRRRCDPASRRVQPSRGPTAARRSRTGSGDGSRATTATRSTNPVGPTAGPATGHCSRWQWWTSTTTRRP